MYTAHVLSETAMMMYHREKTVETSVQVVEQHGRSYEVSICEHDCRQQPVLHRNENRSLRYEPFS